jgi:hypothetical protein
MQGGDETSAYEPSDLAWDGNAITLATTAGPARYDPASRRLRVLKGFQDYILHAMSKRHAYCILGEDRVLADFMMFANNGFAQSGSTYDYVARYGDGVLAVPECYTTNKATTHSIHIITRLPAGKAATPPPQQQQQQQQQQQRPAH